MTAFLIASGALAVMVLLLVLRPLLGRGGAAPARARFDRAVYRDQLEELDRDIARGLIGEAEAKTARLEIERRLLASADQDGAVADRGRRSPAIAATVALLVLGGAVGVYMELGAPGIPDAPYALRVAERGSAGERSGGDHPDVARLAASLAERLRTDPNNREGWQLFARTQATMGNWGAAADAYRNLIALGDASADVHAGYGEMQVLAARGVVTPAAREAFANAVKAEPGSVIARFYLALADAQAGKGAQAVETWVALAGETTDEALRAEIARRVAETARVAGIQAPPLPPAPAPAAPAAAPGPGAADMAAAAGMSEEQRTAMIQGMVSQLAAKLEANPGDFDGWMRLGRAYAVLGEHDRAAEAYGRAAALRPADPAPLLQGVQAMMEAQKENAPIPVRAVEMLRRAEALDPKRPETLWYLGLAEAQAGRKEEAQAIWRRLLAQLPPGGQEHKLVSDAIGALEKH